MQILMITLETMVNIDKKASPVEKRFESYQLEFGKTRVNKLSASKLVLEQDKIGFKSENKSEVKYLRINSSEQLDSQEFYFKYLDPQTGDEVDIEFKGISFIVRLSDTRYHDELRRYTVVELLADFGGFNDGLLLIATALTSTYARITFMASFASQWPVMSNSNMLKDRTLVKKLAEVRACALKG